MKRDYERFEASVNDICARYGLRSRTTVARMIAKQGWKRDLSAIADHMAINSVAVQPGATHRGNRQSRKPVIIDAVALPGRPSRRSHAPEGVNRGRRRPCARGLQSKPSRRQTRGTREIAAHAEPAVCKKPIPC